jgi:hypothetical protein
VAQRSGSDTYLVLPRWLSCRPTFTAPRQYINPFRLSFNLNTPTLKDGLKMYYDDECETCDRKFGSQLAAIQHMNALDHWGPRYECDTCDREFFTQSSANQHMDDTGHWEPQFECETCTKRFHTQLSANQHMDDTGHWERHRPDSHKLGIWNHLRNLRDDDCVGRTGRL